MKKIIVALLLVISLISFQQAGAQQLKYYYYPRTNVYYDLANHQYIYLNNGTWTTVTTLPHGLTASGRRVLVRHSGGNVWVNNATHKQKYYTAPNGRAVGYKGTNPKRNISHEPRGKAIGYKKTNPNRGKGKNK